MNEETLKNRIIVPFLVSIGYHAEQLSFEDNFTIKLGKNTIKKKDYISGRLDILVLLDSEPFIIWELKRELSDFPGGGKEKTDKRQRNETINTLSDWKN